MMNGPLSYYDLLGVIAPGTVFLAGLLLLFGDLKSARLLEGVSVGGLGIFALLAYAGGQMIQAAGNALENAHWWFWDGMPTDWVRTGRHERLLLSDAQVEQLQEVCTSKLGLSIDGALQDLSSAEWDGITSQMYAAVARGELNEFRPLTATMASTVASRWPFCFLLLLHSLTDGSGAV